MGEIFRPSIPALGPSQPPIQWVLGLSRGKVRPGRAADHSPPFSAVVMEGYSHTSTHLLGHNQARKAITITRTVLYNDVIKEIVKVKLKGRVKVKLTLEQATKAQRWSRGIDLRLLETRC